MGRVDPKKFFVKKEVTEQIGPLMEGIPENIDRLFKIISMRQCPEFGHGEECHSDQYGVHENDRFWKEHPESDILDLYRGGEKAIGWFNAGIFRIKDLTKDHDLGEKQLIQQKASASRKHHYDIGRLSSFTAELKYPLYFLDFESYQTAIPLYDGVRPYQQIPFQFSVHIERKRGARLKHISFMAEGSADPRPEFAEVLKRSLGTVGSIVVYNQSFEAGVLRALAEQLPEYGEWVESTIGRMADLLIPFRDFSYYHPAQRGSASIKRVLPAITGVSYEGLEIGDGWDASLSYLYITHGSYDGKKATPKETKKIRKDLETYCGQDTKGMAMILEELELLSGMKS
jgi:hypothetical protein